MRDKSIQAQILRALKRGEGLTHIIAFDRWGTTRLASAIHRFRKAGHVIQTRYHRSQNGARFAEYRLISSAD